MSEISILVSSIGVKVAGATAKPYENGQRKRTIRKGFVVKGESKPRASALALSQAQWDQLRGQSPKGGYLTLTMGDKGRPTSPTLTWAEAVAQAAPQAPRKPRKPRTVAPVTEGPSA